MNKMTFRPAAHRIFALTDGLLPSRDGPRILIYHQVGSGRSHEMNLPTDMFRRQIDWLQTQYRVVGLEQAVERRGDSDAKGLVVLTFDDGYADVYDNAFPLLEDRRLPFTLYLTTGPIEDPASFPDWPGKPLSWEQVKTMAASKLMTVGAHTHSHPDLRIVSEATVQWEVEHSNVLIEDHVGTRPRHFTYTKGWWSPTADPVIRRTYDTATLGMGDAIGVDSDLHQLHRLAVNQSEPFWAWRRKLQTGGRTENLVRRVWRGYRGP